MTRFFIDRPIVAMVIYSLMVLVGVVAMVQLPVALYPNIAPPEILLTARYPGADAVTLEQSVATPIEQQMSGVDKMLYMYSLNQAAGSQMQLRVNFDVTTDPSVDQVLTNLRYTQAASQLPPDVVNQGVSVIKSVTSPLGLFALYSPKGTYDPLFLANYAYVNINDPMTRVPGIGQVLIFGASQYAIRLWINPDTLAKLDITVNEIASALQAQNTVNPAGQLGGDPVPPGQEFTYTVLAQGRLASLADFENVVVRARPDGALVRVKDVARVELGAQNYIRRGRLNGQPAAIVAVYQLPGSNAIEAMRGATKLMEEIKARFPADLDYVTALDTTLAVSAGIREIVKTLVEALLLVVLVVFIFLQGFRATLIPARSALPLRPRPAMRGPLGSFFRGFHRVFERVMGGYLDGSRFLIRKAAFAILLLLVAAAVSGLIGIRLPGGFVPEEDQGYVFANVQLPLAASLDRTAAVNDKLDAILKTQPGIKYYTGVAGFSLLSLVTTTYNSFYFITLDDWDARDKKGLTADVIMRGLNRRLAGVPEAQTFAFSPPAIPGIGTSGGVTFMLEDRAGKDPAFLAENTETFLAAARKRPEFARLFTTLLPSAPQFFAEVDRDKVLKQGITLASVYQALQAFLGGAFVNYFNQYGRVWQVYVQAEGEFRTRAENVGQFYVRNAAGQPVPLSTLVTMRQVNGPEFTTRFNEYRAAQINGILAPGFSTRQGMRALEAVFAQTMSREMGFDYSGMSFQEKVAEEGIPPTAVFGFSLLVVFLLLAAQYESWTLPFGVLLGTPIAVLGALGALWLGRLELDVFSQIGLVMVIGLAAKNAILIVEFAKEEYEHGASLVDAALAGARVRLRPILMTAFAFILGVFPLVISKGAGANSRQILGTTVIGGMLAATLIAVFIIPVTFYVSERFRRQSGHALLPDAVPAPISGGTNGEHSTEGKHP